METKINELTAKAYYETANMYSRMSRPEKEFNDTGHFLLNDYVAASLSALIYEPITFNIPGGKYTPDFFALFDDGTVAFIEVKQEAVAKSGRRYYAGRSSYRDSRSKLRASAETNPWFKFFMAVYNGRDGSWRIEPIVPTRGTELVYKVSDDETKKTTRSKKR